MPIKKTYVIGLILTLYNYTITGPHWCLYEINHAPDVGGLFDLGEHPSATEVPHTLIFSWEPFSTNLPEASVHWSFCSELKSLDFSENARLSTLDTVGTSISGICKRCHPFAHHISKDHYLLIVKLTSANGVKTPQDFLQRNGKGEEIFMQTTNSLSLPDQIGLNKKCLGHEAVIIYLFYTVIK